MTPREEFDEIMTKTFATVGALRDSARQFFDMPILPGHIAAAKDLRESACKLVSLVMGMKLQVIIAGEDERYEQVKARVHAAKAQEQSGGLN